MKYIWAATQRRVGIGEKFNIFDKKKFQGAPNPGKWPSGRSGGLRAERNTSSGLEKKLVEKY